MKPIFASLNMLSLYKSFCFIHLNLGAYIWYNWYNISTAGCFNLSGNPTFFDLNDTSVIDCQNWCYNASAFAVSVKHMLRYVNFYIKSYKRSHTQPHSTRDFMSVFPFGSLIIAKVPIVFSAVLPCNLSSCHCFLKSIYIIITVTWSEVPDHLKLTGTDHQIKRDAECRVWSSDPRLSTRRHSL